MKPMTIWLDGESLPSSREGRNNGAAAPAAICIARRRVILGEDFMACGSLSNHQNGLECLACLRAKIAAPQSILPAFTTQPPSALRAGRQEDRQGFDFDRRAKKQKVTEKTER